MSDGTISSFAHWKENSPISEVTKTSVGLSVHPEGSNANGMYNELPDVGSAGVLCQVNL